MKEDGSINTFIYNSKGQLINETQYNNSKQKIKETYWVWVGTLPLAQIDIPFVNNIAGAHTINYLHTDHLNTLRWATNQSKQKVWSWNSDAYGNTVANEDPLNTGVKTTVPLRFPGQYYDQETGLHYSYFRTYDPDLGRYTQPDPIGLEGGWNMFTYVGGNPVKWGDINGLQSNAQACSSNPLVCDIMLGIGDSGSKRAAKAAANAAASCIGGGDNDDDDDINPTKAQCSKVLKLLKEVSRLGDNLGLKLSPDRLARLILKSKFKTITPYDLPASIRRHIDSMFYTKTLEQIEKICRKLR